MQSVKQSRSKALFNQSLIYGLGNALQSFAGFIFLPFFTSYYTTEEFGIYSLILVFSTVANSIFFLGATSALTRYYYEEDTFEHQTKVVTNTFIIVLLGSFLLAFIGLLYSADISILIVGNNLYKNHIFLISVSTSFNILLTYNLVIFRLDKKNIQYLISSFGSFFLNIILLYLTLVIYRLQVVAPILSSLIVNSIFWFFTFFFITKKVAFRFIEINEILKYLKFGLVIIGIGMMYSTLDAEDRYILKEFSSLDSVGIYSFGQRISGLINVFFIVPSSLVWSVYRMQFHKEPFFNYLSAKIFTYFLNLGLAMVLFSELFFFQLLSIVNLNQEYIDSFHVIPFLMLVGLFYGCTTYLEFGLIIRNRLYYYLIMYSVAFILFWILSIMTIPLFGVMGVVYSKILIFSLLLIALYYVSNKFHPIPLNPRKIFLPIIFILISFIFLGELSSLQIWLKFILYIMYVIANYTFIVYSEDKIKIKNILMNI